MLTQYIGQISTLCSSIYLLPDLQKHHTLILAPEANLATRAQQELLAKKLRGVVLFCFAFNRTRADFPGKSSFQVSNFCLLDPRPLNSSKTESAWQAVNSLGRGHTSFLELVCHPQTAARTRVDHRPLAHGCDVVWPMQSGLWHRRVHLPYPCFHNQV